jgi:hypothetical protein
MSALHRQGDAYPGGIGEDPPRSAALMKTSPSVSSLTKLGRTRLSTHFFLRDFLYSEVANAHGIPNFPDDPALAIAAGTRLCNDLLEPLHAAFGHVTIRSAYRSSRVNGFCSQMQRAGKADYGCGSNARNHAAHIWDRRDAHGHCGAMATIVLPWFVDRASNGADWRSLAWWIHDHLPYSTLYFFPKLWAFNLGWHEKPQRRIDSYVAPRGCLTKASMANHSGSHAQWYADFPKL